MSGDGGNIPLVSVTIRVRGNHRTHTMTPVMLDVLAVIVGADPPAWGVSICDSTGHGTGSVYAALDKLAKIGLITGEWEDTPPTDRPRRRLYHPVLAVDWYRQNRLLPATLPPNGETR